MTSSLSKYKKKLLLLAVMCLAFVAQARAQFFEDDDGPGDFEPPPDNDVPLDTYQWVMMTLAILYGVYVFWKNHKKKLANTKAIIMQPVNEPGNVEPIKILNTKLKTSNHDTVFSFYRSTDSNLSRLPLCTGKGKEKDEALLRLFYAQKKRKTSSESRLSSPMPFLKYQKPKIMKLFSSGFSRKAMYYRAIVLVAAVLALIPALANDGGATSIPVKGSVPVNYYEGFMITVAVAYGIYLIVRARRRRRNSKLPQ